MSGRIRRHMSLVRAAESLKNGFSHPPSTSGLEGDGHDFKSQFSFCGCEPQQNSDFQYLPGMNKLNCGLEDALSQRLFGHRFFGSCGAALDPLIDHRQDHDLDWACYQTSDHDDRKRLLDFRTGARRNDEGN